MFQKSMIKVFISMVVFLPFLFSACDSNSIQSSIDEKTLRATNIQTIEQRVSSSIDDIEESSSGSISQWSSDLELTQESSQQLIGIRFTNITIPKNATITSAYIQFKTDERSSGSSALTIHAQKTSNALRFSTTTRELSNKARTTTSITWSPADWNTIGESGLNQRTSDIKSLVQELVSQANWKTNNAMAFIISGTGKRVAESYDGDTRGAPLLHIEYTNDAVVNPPTTDTTAPIMILNGPSSLTLTVGDVYTELGARATDNIDGDISSDISSSGSVIPLLLLLILSLTLFLI